MPSGIPNKEKARIRQLYAEGKVGRDALHIGIAWRDGLLRAQAEFLLAQVLWPTRRERPRARELAESAQAILRQAGVTGQRAEVDRWLMHHPA